MKLTEIVLAGPCRFEPLNDGHVEPECIFNAETAGKTIFCADGDEAQHSGFLIVGDDEGDSLIYAISTNGRIYLMDGEIEGNLTGWTVLDVDWMH